MGPQSKAVSRIIKKKLSRKKNTQKNVLPAPSAGPSEQTTSSSQQTLCQNDDEDSENSDEANLVKQLSFLEIALCRSYPVQRSIADVLDAVDRVNFYRAVGPKCFSQALAGIPLRRYLSQFDVPDPDAFLTALSKSNFSLLGTVLWGERIINPDFPIMVDVSSIFDGKPEFATALSRLFPISDRHWEVESFLDELEIQGYDTLVPEKSRYISHDGKFDLPYCHIILLCRATEDNLPIGQQNATATTLQPAFDSSSSHQCYATTDEGVVVKLQDRIPFDDCGSYWARLLRKRVDVAPPPPSTPEPDAKPEDATPQPPREIQLEFTAEHGWNRFIPAGITRLKVCKW